MNVSQKFDLKVSIQKGQALPPDVMDQICGSDRQVFNSKTVNSSNFSSDSRLHLR